tara:strand:+ start:91 stop:339 length:249 start_codon:yes stop_codon:yes gene_type:complete
MNINKQLYQVLNCPISKKKEFITYGFVNGIHPNLLKLCKLLQFKNCKHWFLSKMQKKIIESLYKKILNMFLKIHIRNLANFL